MKIGKDVNIGIYKQLLFLRWNQSIESTQCDISRFTVLTFTFQWKNHQFFQIIEIIVGQRFSKYNNFIQVTKQ